jgi:hypothetical protein
LDAKEWLLYPLAAEYLFPSVEDLLEGDSASEFVIDLPNWQLAPFLFAFLVKSGYAS